MNVLRTKAVVKATGLSRTTLWRLERRGDFPKRIRLGPNSTGWIQSEIQEWIESRPRGMSGSGSNQESADSCRPEAE